MVLARQGWNGVIVCFSVQRWGKRHECVEGYLGRGGEREAVVDRRINVVESIQCCVPGTPFALRALYSGRPILRESCSSYELNVLLHNTRRCVAFAFR